MLMGTKLDKYSWVDTSKVDRSIKFAESLAALLNTIDNLPANILDDLRLCNYKVTRLYNEKYRQCIDKMLITMGVTSDTDGSKRADAVNTCKPLAFAECTPYRLVAEALKDLDHSNVIGCLFNCWPMWPMAK